MCAQDAVHLEMFSRPWYNEYFRRVVCSDAHARFCERVYGADLCQHGMMGMAELDFLVSLIGPGDRVLEVGCGNGYITEYIHDRASCTVLGIDFADVAIAQAQARTCSKANSLRFACIDLTQEPVPGSDYDDILLVDSIYFMGEYADSLRKLESKLEAAGCLILSVFQTREQGDPDDVIHPDGTFLAQALRALGFKYTAYDLTSNIRDHWLKNYQVAEELKPAFFAEGNAFLYRARASESAWFKERVDRDALVRYMYVATR